MTTIPETMNAFVLMRHGDMDALEYKTDWPTPKAIGAEVLIKVAACGLNNTDVNTRSGWYSKTVDEATTGGAYQEVADEDPTWGGAPITFPRIQGADTVGTVVACGPDADVNLIGKRVMTDNWLRDWNDPLNKDKTGYFGSECDGGYAEFTKTDYRNVAVVDSPMSDAELATFSCSYSTAEGMLNRANVDKNDRVLITGASGGVGSAAIQLAKRRGATVWAITQSDKADALHDVGADHTLNRDHPLPENQFDVVLDLVAGPRWPDLLDALKPMGRYVASGAIAGPMVTLDVRTLYLKDLSLLGSTAQPDHILPDIISYIERGEIRPLIAETYALRDIHVAQTSFMAKKTIGKIVLSVG